MDPVPELRGLVGGPERVDIFVVDYDPQWPGRFDVERTKIMLALGVRALGIEHVGSTSVPRLAAKPIIDVNVTVADSSDKESYVPDLVAAGYELRVREPESYEHRMLRTSTRDVHVHVFSVGSPEIVRMRVFRDWLREDDGDRELYASTKRALAHRDWPTMQHYADAKGQVVEEIMSRALVATPLQDDGDIRSDGPDE
ncbi:MAG: GrpB family protein [Acidimicrobiia bacterium]